MTDREIVITPNYHGLFEQFLRFAIHAGEDLERSLLEAQERPSLEQQAKVLRVVQGLVAPLTIALQSATTVTEVEKLRGVCADLLANLDKTAWKVENTGEEGRG